MRMTSHFRLDDSFRFRAVGRLEADQSQQESALSLQVAREWSPAYDSFRFRPVGRHEADQSQEDVAVSLQAVREWSPACKINSKHVVLSVEGTAMFATEHHHLNRIATLLEVPEKVRG
ncbi:hypothetical protein TNCV_1406441 [Trichonephila clavipes]|nr:hypothetical protein TNCV_1406441 [Trichonephila clavipes]